MIDYSKITDEEIAKRTAAMPIGLKTVYESDNFGFELMKLANDKYFDENEANALQMLTGLYLMGFMNEQEFRDEIANELYVEPTESNEMVAKIKSLIAGNTPAIAKPVFAASSSIPKPVSPTSNPTPTPQTIRTIPTPIISPSIPTIPAKPASNIPPTSTPNKAPAPFMIHTAETPKPLSSTQSFIPPKNDLLKPTFGESANTSAEPIKVKIDFNGGSEKPKIVNYTASEVAPPKPKNPSVYPTIPIPTSRTSNLPSISPDIHPENVIDLKDLPK